MSSPEKRHVLIISFILPSSWSTRVVHLFWPIKQVPLFSLTSDTAHWPAQMDGLSQYKKCVFIKREKSCHTPTLSFHNEQESSAPWFWYLLSHTSIYQVFLSSTIDLWVPGWNTFISYCFMAFSKLEECFQALSSHLLQTSVHISESTSWHSASFIFHKVISNL